MNSTDWESKFSSIVRDTESNLERVKSKLGSARTATYVTDNGSILLSGTSQDALSRSQNSQVWMSSHIPAATEISHLSAINETAYIPMDKSPSMVMLLNDKLDSQSKIIDQLVKYKQTTEEERDNYGKQVHDLREEIQRLRSRMAERGVDLLTEHKMSRLQQEWTNELQTVQTQVQVLRRHNDELTAKNGALATALLELQRFVNNEVDYLRREVNAIKNRTDSLSVDLTTRQHSLPPVLESNKHSVSFLSPSTYNPAIKSRQPSVLDHDDITLLRSEYKQMQKKLKALETNFRASINSSSGHKSRHRNRSRGRTYNSESNEATSLNTSELDVSTSPTLTNYSNRRLRASSASFDEAQPSTDVPSDLSSDNDSLSLDNV